jgi:non-heme chloroperoxidase
MNFIQAGTDRSGNPVNIYYTDYGSGKPVILIHGWPLSGAMWEYQVDALVSSGHRVIAYDRRGFGRSSHPWDGYDYDTLTDDLKALIDQLELEDITLVGFSMGGGEVARYFSRHSGKGVSQVVLIASVTPYLLKTDDNPNGVSQDVFNQIADSLKNDRIGFLDEFGKTFFGVGVMTKPLSSSLLEYFRMLGSMASPRATIECAKSFSTTDFRNEVKLITVPTLIIHGDADKTVPIDATGREAAKAVPDNNFLIYDGAPHGLFYTDRRRLNNDLLEFLGTDNVSLYQYSNEKANETSLINKK